MSDSSNTKYEITMPLSNTLYGNHEGSKNEDSSDSQNVYLEDFENPFNDNYCV